MRLLVSPMNIEEARAALLGGADILDVKNPKEGSLGANFPWAIREVADLSRGRVPVSATIGDLDYKPGTSSLAALGAAVSGADYIKAGLLAIKTTHQAEEMLEAIVKAVKDLDSNKKVVAAAYSDYQRVGSISPLILPEVAKRTGAEVVMVDTAIKDGRSTFEFMDHIKLMDFISSAHSCELEVAIAGAIGFQHLEILERLQPDIIGVRGIVCGGDRLSSIKAGLVRKLKMALV
ncbi:MAG: (5-formylfuran-3-yl)methyl phosphate synthase [Methanotrichaceae archaeon]|nr:(5-formylfuran-3-yl)methyl phosphate synthase [Methanotrichaceae archaeon]MDD1757163.1 (5-formylfuran-3-yl)methyl phosphate synthase [Methanotrichaceae archaeon]